MPVDTNAIRLLVTDDSRRGVASFSTGMGKVGRSARRATNSVDRMTQSTFRLGGALQAVTAALSVRQLTRYADTWKRVTNQLKVVEKGSLAVAEAQQKVFNISQDTRQSLEATTALYTRMKRAQDTLKVSNEDLETVVTAVNKGVAASGATTKEAEAGIIQLSQAFTSGKLAGDELRSVMENIPIIAKAMAEGLGIPFEEFREQAKNLKPAELVKGLLNSASDLETAFGRTSVTIGQSFQILENSFVRFTGMLDERYGISQRFTNLMLQLAQNMNEVATAVGKVGAALTAIFASKALKRLIMLLPQIRMLRLAGTATIGAAGYFGAERAMGGLGREVYRQPYDSDYELSIDRDYNPLAGGVSVTRGDYLQGFMRNLDTLPSILVDYSKTIIDTFRIMFETIIDLAKAFITELVKAFKNPVEWIRSFRYGADVLGKVVPKTLERELRDLETGGFTKFFRDIRNSALEIATERTLREGPGAQFEVSNTNVDRRFPVDFEALFGKAYEGLNLLGAALEGVNPTFDKVVTGINNTVNAWATQGPAMGLAVGLNSLLQIFGSVESESERLARQQREMVEALTESAYASERAARSIENFARSLTGLSKSELEREADFGKTLRAVRGRYGNLTDSILSDLFGENLGITGFYERELVRRQNLGRGGIQDNERSEFDRLTKFLNEFANNEDFLKAVAQLRARFQDLDTAEGFKAALRNVQDAERALTNFGNYIDGSFEGALERFQHERAVQRPIAGALERLFTTTFENFASFDFATGRFAAREIADLSQREINRLEELFVSTRLEAAKEGANKLVAGYRSLAEMEANERFQADIVRARSTLSRDFGEAGSDVFLQRSAIAQFNATLKSIRDSMTLARGRANNATGASVSGGSVAGKRAVGSGGYSAAESQIFEDAIAGGISVDLSGGDRVDVVRHALDEFSEIFEGAVMDGTARMTIDLSGDAIDIVKRQLTDLSEILRLSSGAMFDLDLSKSASSGNRLNIRRYSIDALDEVFKGPVITQEAPFVLDMTANDRVSVTPYILNSLADVFTGGAIDQTAPYDLDMNANDRVTIQRKMIDNLNTVFDFSFDPRLTQIPIAGSVLIDRQKIHSIDDVFDLSAINTVKITDLIDLKVGTYDFFFALGDQTENIRLAVETVFSGIAETAKATVEVAELVDFNSESLKPALYDAVTEGLADGRILVPGPGSVPGVLG